MQDLVLKASTAIVVVAAGAFWFLSWEPVFDEDYHRKARNAFENLGDLDLMAEVGRTHGQAGKWQFIEDDDTERAKFRTNLLMAAIALNENRCSARKRMHLMRHYKKYMWAKHNYYFSGKPVKPDVWMTVDDKLINGIMSGLSVKQYLIHKDFPSTMDHIYRDYLNPDYAYFQRNRDAWNTRQACLS